MKKFYISIAMLGIGLAMMAAPLSPEQSLQRCRTATAGMRTSMPMAFTASDLSYTVHSGSEPVVYVFSRPGAGYVITSADDVASPLLAYSTESTFSATDIPENMAWWLDEYRKEIEHARTLPRQLQRKDAANERPQRAPIAPLCATQWNQSSPYNLLCPKVNGQYTYSGCVATAMAQVMKHHNWPDVGVGSHSYTWNNQTLSLDFSEQRFDWENMEDTYTTGNTTAQNMAVAQLMYACGISVNMNYGLNGSGAMSSNVPGAFTSRFKYGQSTTFLSRDYVPLLTWEKIIYESLQMSAPVYYSGQNFTVGHAFVCDGYSEDGYFHFNWGWGGLSDGYFRLTALDPSSQGIGGSNNGYNIFQYAMVRALPQPVYDVPMVVMVSEKPLTAVYNKEAGTMTVNGGFMSASGGSTSVELGLKIANVKTGEAAVYGTGEVKSIRANGLLTSIAVSNVPQLADGVYCVTPMVNANAGGQDAEWEEMLMPLGEPTLAYVEVKESDITYTYPEFEFLEIDSFELMTPVYTNSNYKVKIKFSNPLPTEIYEYFTIGLVKNNSIIGMCDPYSLNVFGNSSETVEFVGNFGAVAAGDYQICVLQPYGNTLYATSELLPVTIAAAPEETDFYITDFVIYDATNVDCSDIRFSFDLHNDAGYFSYPIRAYIFPNSGSYAIASNTYPPVFLNEGESQHLDLHWSIPYLPIDRTYLMGIYGNTTATPLATPVLFKVTTNGVEVVDTDTEWFLTVEGNEARLFAPERLTAVKVYNMSGMLQAADVNIDSTGATVDMSSLGSGIYLVQGITASSSRTMRLIRK